MKYKLMDVAEYRKENMPIEKVNVENYISTENMIPEKGGITLSAGLPNTKSVALYRKGDILISNIRPYFKKIWFAEYDGGASNDVLIIRPNKIDNKYLYYLLLADSFFDYMTATSKGTKMPRGDKNAIMEYEFNVLGPEEGTNITSILSSLDNKLKVNKLLISNLEKASELLFKHWFIDFEFPNEKGQPYKSSGGEMIESELGMIPRGWNVEVLSNISIHKKDLISMNKIKTDFVHHFSIPNFDTSQMSTKDSVNSIKSSKYIISRNSIMFSKLNPITPRVWHPIVPDDGLLSIASTEFVVLESMKRELKHFLLNLVSSLEFTNYLLGNVKGSTGSRQRVSPSDAIKYSFAFDEKIAERHNQIVKPFYEKVKVLRLENEKLRMLRETLLPKLLSGEIEVPILEPEQV